MDTRLDKLNMDEKERKLFKHVKVGDKYEKVSNPISGEEAWLTPEAVAFHDIIWGGQLSLEKEYNEKVEELFYAARSVFVKNWPKEYMQLID